MPAMPTSTPTWLVYAILAALCAASINVFAKIGMKDINPDLSTAMRSVVQAVFVVTFAAVIGAFGHVGPLRGRPLAMGMIVLSGMAGGLSWIFAFRAVHLAEVAKVAPIDKLSLPLGILLAVIVLGERPSVVNWVGILVIAGGAYLATMPK